MSDSFVGHLLMCKLEPSVLSAGYVCLYESDDVLGVVPAVASFDCYRMLYIPKDEAFDPNNPKVVAYLFDLRYLLLLRDSLQELVASQFVISDVVRDGLDETIEILNLLIEQHQKPQFRVFDPDAEVDPLFNGEEPPRFTIQVNTEDEDLRERIFDIIRQHFRSA